MRRSKTLRAPGGLWQEMKKSRISYLFILPYVALFFIFVVLPVAVSLVLSFTSFNVLEPPRFTGLANYTRLLFNDSVFLKGVQNTIILSVVLGPGSYLLCMLFAWFINELKPKMRAFVTLIFYAPSISGNIYLIWQVMFSGDEYGLSLIHI